MHIYRAISKINKSAENRRHRCTSVLSGTALTSACLSFSGLKSRSCMITVSADVRLMPRPPALVDRRKTGIGLSGALYSSISSCRNYHQMKN